MAPSSPYETTEVVGHLAHELRQPLSTIESIAYYLEMVLPPESGKLRHQVDKLQQAVAQASWILTDAVHFLQASPPSPQVLDLDEFVAKTVIDASTSDRMSVRLELSRVSPAVRLDPEQLRHLVQNVLLVLRQVLGPAPELLVRTVVAGKTVRLSFEVECVAVSSSDIEAMFDPFSPHLPPGSGLALASVRRIALAHGGQLQVHRDEDGYLRLQLDFPLAA